MSLTNLSLTPFLIGLAAIAALLVILQLLRVRYQREDVVTTMFWREAIEESRARVLLKRFRHPWAYLLVFAIAALLWLALAEPQRAASDQTDYVVLLDGSALMASGDLYERAASELLSQIGQLPRDRRRVYWCGGRHGLLLDRGEESVLLGMRLKDRQPEASPASVDAFLLKELESCQDETIVYLFGKAAVDKGVLEAMPDTVTVNHVRDGERDIRRGLNNGGVAAIGVAPAASGIYDRVDVLVDWDSRGIGWEKAPLSVDLDGVPWEGVSEGDPDARVRVLSDLPANGQTLTVRFSGADDLDLDNQAQLVLPIRESIRVRVAEPLRELLTPILKVDRAVTLVDENPDIVLGESASEPHLLLVARESQKEAFVLSDRWPTTRAQQAVEVAFQEIGIDQIDATALATSLNTTVRLGAEEGETKAIRVWGDLFSPNYNLMQSSAFPLFIAKAVRWLADEPELTPYVAVGESNESLTIAGASFAPPRVGHYDAAGGSKVIASLVPPLGGPSKMKGVDFVLKTTSSDSDQPWITWLLLLVLVLLFLEWVFFQKGWMP